MKRFWDTRYVYSFKKDLAVLYIKLHVVLGLTIPP
jgi:hypothetical protein